MSIHRRTVFFDPTGGVARFWDWAQVSTSIGPMAEPFVVGARHAPQTSFETYDPADEINRVDDIRAMSVDKSMLILSGGDHHLHGGYQIPRTGQ